MLLQWVSSSSQPQLHQLWMKTAYNLHLSTKLYWSSTTGSQQGHRESLLSAQPLHTRTGWSQPREGTGLVFIEQFPHTP